MENAVEALKMAFAVMLLTLALSLSIAFFSKARSTSEIVLQSSDKMAYYDYTRYDLPEDPSGNRIVSYETIIPTLYKYNKERYKVVFKQGKYDSSTGTLSEVDPLEIYSTTTNPKNWNKNYINDFDGISNKDSTNPELIICSFDIIEETQRNEPWVGNAEQVKLHLDAIFGGGEYKIPFMTGASTINYANNPLSKRNNKFVEQIGEITTTNTDENEDEVIGNKTTKKRIITYILIK